MNSGCSGQSYSNILRCFYPELITSVILYFGLNFLDSWFVSKIHFSCYATLSITSILIHFITKISEGFSIGVVVLCGLYNGIGDYKQVGRSLVNSFWLICIIGAIISSALYIGASWIYYFMEVPDCLSDFGVPFLQLRSVGIFFNFVFFALIGFLRGIKNTRVPMMIFIMGACVFAFFDYALIFGEFGFKAMAFQGSALAYTIQYAVMCIAAIIYILFNSDIKKYNIKFFVPIRLSDLKSLTTLSWPVMVDKASFVICQMWLAKMIGFMAKSATMQSSQTLIASFAVIKDIERFAILPGIAFAQVITLLVSNDYKLKNWTNIKINIHKILFISFVMVGILLIIFSVQPFFFIRFFDKDGMFIYFAAKIIPFTSILVFFDLLQLILSAALRGATNTKTVMMVRVVGLLCFIPISYVFAALPIENIFYKFIILYSLLYIIDALMGIFYLKKLKDLAKK